MPALGLLHYRNARRAAFAGPRIESLAAISCRRDPTAVHSGSSGKRCSSQCTARNSLFRIAENESDSCLGLTPNIQAASALRLRLPPLLLEQPAFEGEVGVLGEDGLEVGEDLLGGGGVGEVDRGHGQELGRR